MAHLDNNAPLFTVAFLLWLARQYDRSVKPLLLTVAIISAILSAAGIFAQFDNPTFADLVLSIVIGVALLCIRLIFWIGAWHLPQLAGKPSFSIYALVAVLGFSACAALSMTANLSATGSTAAVQIDQQEEINRFDNAGAKAVLYVDQAVVARDAIQSRAAIAKKAEADEIAGRGPTGIGGAGSVSNSFGEAAGIYETAAESLDTVLARARGQADALAATVAEMRTVQADAGMSAKERSTQLKILSSQASSDIRGLLALDPALSIRAAADAIAVGVPPRSQARASSQARIAEISADIRAFASVLEAEADRVAARAPQVPEQVARSHTEVLFAAATRMPALMMVAILLDACGWVAIGWRVAIYSALKARMRDEEDAPGPSYITITDVRRFTDFVDLMLAARNQVENADGKPRRGRRPALTSTVKRKTQTRILPKPDKPVAKAKPARKASGKASGSRSSSKATKQRGEGQSDA
ncbi:MAG: hypothetical protein AAGG09_00655 [Pseudomonadota bacterium]